MYERICLFQELNNACLIKVATKTVLTVFHKRLRVQQMTSEIFGRAAHWVLLLNSQRNEACPTIFMQ